MLPRLDTILPPAAAAPVGALPAFGEGRQAAFQRALQTLVGQQVSAEVLSKYNDGSFLVRVADHAVRMALPPSVQVGADVPLTVIAAQPRPTFQLGSGSLPGQSPALVYSDHGASADLADGLYGPAPHAAEAPATGSGASAARPTPGSAQSAQNASAAATSGTSTTTATTAGAAQATANSPAQGSGAASAAEADLPASAAPLPRGAASAGAAGGATPAPLATGSLAIPGGALPASAASATAASQNAAGNPLAANAAAVAAGLQAAGVDLSRPQRLAAGLLSKAPLTPAAELPDLDPATPAATLSPTARALNSVLSTAHGAATALIGKSALFGDGPPNTAQLAQRLHDTLAQSGLFYESHVAEWARGERSLQDLLREPQMQRLAPGPENAARAASNGPDLSAAQMINQQLQAHEQGRVQWQGQAWPGQPMQWELRREPPEQQGQGQDGSDEEALPIWRSGMRFRFALLGEVAATVTLVGTQVHIQMQTGSDTSATTLRAYAGQLEQAMAAAGVPLAALSIRPDSEAGDE